MPEETEMVTAGDRELQPLLADSAPSSPLDPVKQNKIEGIIKKFKSMLDKKTRELFSKNVSICEFIEEIVRFTNSYLFDKLITPELCPEQAANLAAAQPTPGARKSKNRSSRGGRKSKKRRLRGGRKSKKRRLRGGRKSKKRII